MLNLIELSAEKISSKLLVESLVQTLIREFFLKQWREAPGTGNPSFPISSAEMPDTVSAISLKLLLLYV